MMDDTTPTTGADAAGAVPANCPPGSRFPLLPGVRSRMVQTPRLATHVYESGAPGAEAVVLIHGNASSARFFEQLLTLLPDYYVIAPDLRGYGASEAKVVDATRGLRDYADDVHAVVETLGLERFHLLGWSLGGCIAMQYTLEHPERLRSLTLQAPGSPYGYGGTQGAEGKPNYDDCAGSGGGLINPDVVKCYLAKDDTADSPFAPRSGMRQFYVKPGFTFPPEWEDALVEQMLMMVIGDQYYPGDAVDSPNWPFKGPGVYGSNNALSPKYCDLSALGDLRGGPPILWIRGADDQVVSDMALADAAALGQLGIIPGWPGAEVCPPQPMLTQIRAMLERYAAGGGSYREEVLTECGHSPCIEHAETFRALFTTFMSATDSGQGASQATASAGDAGPASAAGADAPAAGAAAATGSSAPAEAEPAPAEPAPAVAASPEPAEPIMPAEPSVSEATPAPVTTTADDAPSAPAPEPATGAPVAASAPAQASQASEAPAPRTRGFFARLFGRGG